MRLSTDPADLLKGQSHFDFFCFLDIKAQPNLRTFVFPSFSLNTKNIPTSDGYAVDKSLGGFILFRNLSKSSFNVPFCFAYLVLFKRASNSSNLLLIPSSSIKQLSCK